MQDLAWAWRIFGSFCQEYPILGQELPLPRIRTSHGGLRKFGSEVDQEQPLQK